MRSAIKFYAVFNNFANTPVRRRPIKWSLLRCQSTLTQQADAIPEKDVEESHSNDSRVKSYEELPGPPGGLFNTSINMYKLWRDGTWKKPHILYARKQEIYGNIYKENVFGRKAVLIYDLDEIEKVFREEGKWPTRGKITPFLAYREERNKALGVILNEGQDWQRNRASLSKKMMRPKEIGAYTDVMNSVVTDLMKTMAKFRNEDDGIVLNMEKLLFRWAMESSSTVIFGKRLGLLGEEVNLESELFIKAVHDIFESLFWLYTIPIKYHKKLNTKHWKNSLNAWDTVFEVAEKLINEKLNEVSRKDDNSDDLMTYLASQSKISVQEMYANATELLMGSVDTTSYLMVWTLYLLSENPQVQEKLNREVTQVVPRGVAPNFDELNRLLYLKAVIKETLRLRPPVIMIMRILEKDIVLKNYNIPSGTLIQMPFVTIAKDPNHFKDPLEFKPERWLRSESEESTAFKALPFGFGPRMCLGKRLSELEAHLLLTRISQNFQVVKTKDDIEPVMTGLYIPDKPLDLKFVDRC